MQDHVVELAEQQRRIARMHRQLAAATALGATVDPSAVPSASASGADSADAAAQGEAASAPPQLVTVSKTAVHEFVHGESWLALVGQVAVAVALGSGYERMRSKA